MGDTGARHSAARHAAWRVPGYEITELLGAGASGQVWRARVRSSGDEVALKRIRLDDAQQVRDAQREAAVLATLDHPHLIRIHEFLALDDDAVLVLDLAAGGSLASLLGARGRLTPGEAITALAPVGAALASAHGAGVVHGDVTPANVLFTDVGLPLLADLGVARLLGTHAPVRSTPAYIDPAVAAGCVPGAASDVFMLAATAVHALTGEPLWRGASVDAALALATAGDTGDAAPRLQRAGVPEQMAAVVCRALATEPQLRGTAADFALDLRHAGEPVAVELAAGRARPPAQFAAAGPAQPPGTPPATRGHPTAAAHAAESAVVTTQHPGRPDFTRPHRPAAAAPAAAPLTHGVRARVPVLPRRRTPWWRRRAVVTTVAAVVAALAAAGALLWWPGTHSDARAQAPGPGLTHAASRAATGTPVSPAPATLPVPPPAEPSASTPPASKPPASRPASEPPARIDAAGITRVLTRLDAQRARAFATRAPALLGRVYADAALLARDAATLRRVVPAGCGLRGATTSYRVVHVVARTGTGLTVIASATLSASRLVCDGSVRGRAPGAGPARLRISLAWQRPVHDGYRITAMTAA